MTGCDDGLWLNMLLYPSEFRRTVCRTRAMNVIAALFPNTSRRPLSTRKD